jgi:choline dehydrogenase-like flavoprotein
VVDADGLVHGLANLYVAGSSVFPSYSASNPTMNLIALALRLADHLKKVTA